MGLLGMFSECSVRKFLGAKSYVVRGRQYDIRDKDFREGFRAPG